MPTSPSDVRADAPPAGFLDAPRWSLAGSRALALVALFALAGSEAWHTWRSWADPLVDFGRELYVPWRLGQGDGLHSDLAWFQGPLSAWYHAAVLQLAGPGMDRILVSNLLVAVVALVATSRLARRFASPGSTWWALAGWISFLGFRRFGGIGNYNWIAPYSHELTHGITLALTSLALALPGRDGPRSPARLALAGIAGGLVLLTKVEVAAALVLCSLPELGRALALRRWRSLAVALGCALVPPALAFATFAADLGAGAAGQALLAPIGHALNEQLHELPFYSKGSGLDDPGAHTWRLVRSSLQFALVFALPSCLALASRLSKKRLWLAIVSVAIPAASAAVAWWAIEREWFDEWRFLPALCLVSLAWTWRSPTPAGKRTRLAFSLFALGCQAKIFLAARITGYGFALSAPAVVLAILFTLDDLPRLFQRERAGRNLAILGTLVVWITLAVDQGVQASHWQRFQEHGLGRGADRLVGDNRAKLAQEALEDLERRLEPGEPFLVLPEGVMLNYLLRRPSPSRIQNFMPPEFLMFGEEIITEELVAAEPRIVVIAHKDTSEYGLHPFSDAYAFDIGQWLRGEYVFRAIYGAPPLSGQGFGIAILERR